MTGRRVSELAALNIGDIAPMGDTYMVTWQHVKGNKRLRDTLEPFVARILTDYLQGEYGPNWRSMPSDTAVWVSLSTHGMGERLSIWGIAGVYKRRLGISKVHTSRYTFASLMEQLGASLPEIQRRLGHQNSNTTDRYLKKAASPENKHGKGLGKLIGFGEDAQHG
jgi:integrase